MESRSESRTAGVTNLREEIGKE